MTPESLVKTKKTASDARKLTSCISFIEALFLFQETKQLIFIDPLSDLLNVQQINVALIKSNETILAKSKT